MTGAAAKGGKPKRGDRVGDQVRSELMDLLLRGELRDPRAVGVHVSKVAMTADLRQAKVQVRLANNPSPSDAQKQGVVRALEHASGHLRRLLASRLGLRHVPDLRFYWDDGADNALRVQALLSEIGAESDPEVSS